MIGKRRPGASCKTRYSKYTYTLSLAGWLARAFALSSPSADPPTRLHNELRSAPAARALHFWPAAGARATTAAAAAAAAAAAMMMMIIIIIIVIARAARDMNSRARLDYARVVSGPTSLRGGGGGASAQQRRPLTGHLWRSLVRPASPSANWPRALVRAGSQNNCAILDQLGQSSARTGGRPLSLGRPVWACN